VRALLGRNGRQHRRMLLTDMPLAGQIPRLHGFGNIPSLHRGSVCPEGFARELGLLGADGLGFRTRAALPFAYIVHRLQVAGFAVLGLSDLDLGAFNRHALSS
jgi:hypothetical protein